MNATHIGVIGAGNCDQTTFEIAKEVGKLIAENNWILVCGGLGGVMEAASKGCFESGGMTVGLLPGFSKEDANPYIKIPIPTGLGEVRNTLVVRASDILIAIAGGYGTLSEIGFALKTGKTVIGLHTWPHIQGILYVKNPKEAVEMVLSHLP